MPISVSLSGRSYFLCAYGVNQGLAETEEFREALSHANHIHHTYVVLGTDGEYFKKFKNDRTGQKRYAYNMTDEAWATQSSVRAVLDSGVEFLSLGEEKHFFMRSADNELAWRLPADAASYVESRPSNDPVRYLWFGKNGAWVAQTGQNSRRMSLHGQYGSLKTALEYNTGKITALSMNLEYDRNYFVLFSDGETQGNPSGAPLTLENFRAWVGRWRA